MFDNVTEEERQRISSTDIDQKVSRSKEVIRSALERFGQERIAIAWTGGKDSTLMLWLYRQVCDEFSIQMPSCMFIDEGDLFEEIVDLVNRVKKEWGLSVIIVKNTDISSKAPAIGDVIRVKELSKRNRQEIARLDFHEDTFSFEPESYICNHLMKTLPMNTFIEENGIQALSTAIRWDEQEARLLEDYFSPRYDPSPDHIRIHPILHFKERDVWDTTHAHKIPFCSLYYKGYRSLGTKNNTTKNSNAPAWEQDLENTPERGGRGQDKEEIMAKLRDLGYM